MQPQHIYRLATEITETITQGTPLFLDNRPWKNPMREKWCSRYEGFIIMQFLNISRVPKMAHPSENFLGRSTYPRRWIFWLITHRTIDPIATAPTP